MSFRQREQNRQKKAKYFSPKRRKIGNIGILWFEELHVKPYLTEMYLKFLAGLHVEILAEILTEISAWTTQIPSEVFARILLWMASDFFYPGILSEIPAGITPEISSGTSCTIPSRILLPSIPLESSQQILIQNSSWTRHFVRNNAGVFQRFIPWHFSWAFLKNNSRSA